MFLALALLACFVPQADPRYELGWRLKALEKAWQEERSPEVRTGLLPCWERATQGFFSGRTDLAAQALDEARARLAGRAPGWWESLALTPEARLLDVETTSLELELTRVYEAELPPEFELVLSAPSWRAEIGSLPWKGRVPLAKGVEGLHTLTFELRAEGCSTGSRSVVFSMAETLEARLSALETALGRASGPANLATATARGLHARLEELAWGAEGESDVDGALLLAAAEAASSSAHQETPALPRSEFLWIPQGATSVPVRVRLPELAPGARAPLVLAIHGAGGSENLFFEGYGGGAIVALAAGRGWAVVAPRIAMDAPVDLVALSAALTRELPLDPRRVVLVGHSMGAMLASAAVNSAPQSFRAAALLGGAGSLRDPAAWRALPVFLAAGERDFARSGVERMRDQLAGIEAEGVRFKIYPATEHITIVAEALPDAFAFFDTVLR